MGGPVARSRRTAGPHTIGSIRFAPDATLFVGSGDGADVSFADPNAMAAQDLTSLRGKILRVNDDGTAPVDNPFYDGTNSNRSKVWAYGVRNPFAFHLHPGTNEPYFGEVGWNTWEEFNRGFAGANYGWPCYEGSNPQPAYQSAFPQCSLVTNSTPPLLTYDHTVGSAPIGGPLYEGTAYPQEYRGNLFVADYSGNWIRRLIFDQSGVLTSSPYFATSVPAPTNLEVGPDGLIYYTSFTTGEVRRILFDGPLAVATANPRSGYSPLTVDFSSDGSNSPDGAPLIFAWNFGDGTTSTIANPTHVYTSATVRTFVATLTVTNQLTKVSATATTSVTVGSTPPVPTITAPLAGASMKPGQTMVYSGTATDPDETLGAQALQWIVLLHHNTHVHTLTGSTGPSGSFQAEFHGPIGTYSYELILTATDTSGLAASTNVLVAIVPDTSSPTVPAALSATAISGHVDLAWSASTDDVAVDEYRIERCQGAGCSNFVQIAATTATTFTDFGVFAGGTFVYRVRAVDPSLNVSGFSPTATASLAGAGPPPPGLVAAYAL